MNAVYTHLGYVLAIVLVIVVIGGIPVWIDFAKDWVNEVIRAIKR